MRPFGFLLRRLLVFNRRLLRWRSRFFKRWDRMFEGMRYLKQNGFERSLDFWWSSGSDVLSNRSLLSLDNKAINSANESIDMMMKIDPHVQADGVSECKPFNLLRQLRLIYQDRNNRNSAFQRVSNFKTNKIRWVVNPTCSLFAFAHPVRTDHSHEDLGTINHVLDVFAKIDAVRNRIKIHEYIPLAEFGLEP